MKTSGFYDIYVPSLKQYKAFRELTTRHQKMLTKSIMAEDGPYKTELIKCIIMILKENSIDNIVIDHLTIIDCLSILLALKCYSIGSTLNLNVTCGNCKSKHKVTIPLIKLYTAITKLDLKPKILNIKNQKLICSLPSIKKELAIMYRLKNLEANEENAKQINLLNVARFVSDIGSQANKDFLKSCELDDLKKILANILKYNKALSEIFGYKIKCPGSGCQRTIARQLKLEYPVFYAFIKLLFSDDLRRLYKDIYFLNKIGLQAEYIDSMTAIERTLFWSLYSEEQKNKKSKTKKPVNSLAGI